MNKLIKLICIKECIAYTYKIKKGDIVETDYFSNLSKIAIFIPSYKATIILGYFNSADFLPLEDHREQIINKILENK
jgi:hypothetical protein